VQLGRHEGWRHGGHSDCGAQASVCPRTSAIRVCALHGVCARGGPAGAGRRCIRSAHLQGIRGPASALSASAGSPCPARRRSAQDPAAAEGTDQHIFFLPHLRFVDCRLQFGLPRTGIHSSYGGGAAVNAELAKQRGARMSHLLEN